jgi:hypothetical protein
VSTYDKWLKQPGGYQKYYKLLARRGVKSGAKGRAPATPAKEPPEAIHEEAEEVVSDLEESETPAKPRAKASKKPVKAEKASSKVAVEVSPVPKTPRQVTGKMTTTHSESDWCFCTVYVGLLFLTLLLCSC